MTRPAAPESETPEVDAVLTAPDGAEIVVHGLTIEALAELARSLERRLSLAQTEIKGLQAERDLHYARLAGLLFSGALDKYTGGDVQLWAAEYTKKLTEAQTRIAELEKDAARYRWLRDCTNLNRPIAIFFDSTKYGSEVNTPEATDAAIDAALKDRA